MTSKLTRKNFEFPYINNSSDPIISWCWNEFGVPNTDDVIGCCQNKPGWRYECFYGYGGPRIKIHFWQNSDDIALFSLIWADLL